MFAVLVDRADAPRAEELPGKLKRLAMHQALTLGEPFEFGLQDLISRIDKIAQRKAEKAAAQQAAAQQAAEEAAQQAAEEAAQRAAEEAAAQQAAATKAPMKAAAEPVVSSARPLSIGDLAQRRDEARPVPVRETTPGGPSDPSLAPFTHYTDEVDCSVFAPPACRPGETAFVQVFAHLPDEAEVAASLATEFDEDAARRAVRSLLARIPQGETLVFDLSFRDLQVPDPIQTLIWRGRPDSVQFEVPVPRDMRLGTVVGTVGVSLGSIPVGHVKFKLAIANAAREDARAVGDDARRYSQAFISYASPDRGEVLRRTQMLAPLGIRYFQDVLDLEPGERWERMLYRQIDDCDLFLLFWSSAAKRSEWVRREVDYALRRKAGDDFAPPEIRPIILEGPPVVPPWEELAHIHFNDRLVWLIGSDMARAEVRE
jgi:hypothetical protein